MTILARTIDGTAALPLTEPEIAMLRRIVRMNGGGVPAYKLDADGLASLRQRDLVRGKRCWPAMIVHTEAGLRWVLDHPQPKQET